MKGKLRRAIALMAVVGLIGVAAVGCGSLDVTPTPQPTHDPSTSQPPNVASSSETPNVTPTPTPSETPNVTPTPTPSETPSVTPTPTPADTHRAQITFGAPVGDTYLLALLEQHDANLVAVYTTTAGFSATNRAGAAIDPAFFIERARSDAISSFSGGEGGTITVNASSPSEKHGWRVLGGMMGPVQ